MATPARQQRGVLTALLLCLALSIAGCGQPSPAGAPDYTKDQALNTKAQLVAGPLLARLDGDPTYGGMRIVAQGIEFDVVGNASAAVNSAIVQIRKSVPVQTRKVKHSWVALQALTTRLNKDQPVWRTKGVTLTMWGPDVGSNRVKVWLAKFDEAAASALSQAYGADWIVVSRESKTVSAI